MLVDGVGMAVDTRKAVALLARLATAPGAAQSRGVLAALLWAQSDESRARAALRRTLSALRRALDDRFLETDRDVVRLAGDWTCDVVQMRSHLAATASHGHPREHPCPDCFPSLRAAVGLVGGELLSGFALRDAPDFDLWVSEEAEAVRRDHRDVLGRLVRGLAATGHLEEALQHARDQVCLDPVQEPAQRRLMLLLAWTGRRAAALRQYEQVVATLDTELGVPPLAETSALAAAIRDDATPAPPAAADTSDFAASTSASAMTTRRTATDGPRGGLVGRDDELARMLAAVRAPGHLGRLVTIHGEAGAGKTRLADELVAAIGDESSAIRVRCHPRDAQLPYAPVVEALRQAHALLADGVGDVDAHWREEAARLLPDLAVERPAARPLESPGAQARFVEGVWQTLAGALAGSGTGVLVLDDLHRADAATLDLLAYAASRLDRLRIVVVLCWRDGDLADPQSVASMTDEATVAGAPVLDVGLGRLGRDEVAAMARDAGVEVGAELLDRLMVETEGLPLAIVAYLEDVAAADTNAWPLPRSLATVYRIRLAELDELSRQVLTGAATIGRSFDIETLAAASGRADEEVLDALDVLLARAMIVEGDDAFDFTHDKLRAAVYDQVSQARRRLLHQRVAAAIRGRAPVDAAAVAFHEQRAGRAVEAAVMHLQAAEDARALFANRAAQDHLQQALDLGHPDVGGIREAMGDLQTLQGAYADALASLDAAIALATTVGDRARLEHRAAAVHLRSGDLDRALARLESAEAGTADDTSADALRARICAERALVEARSGDTSAAQGSALTALRLAEDATDRRAVAQARNILGVLARRRGAPAEAQRHLEISADLAARLDDPAGEVAAHNNLALALRDGGDVDRAMVHATAAVDLCARVGDRHREAALHSNLADLLHAMGREDEARDHLTRSATLFAAVGARPERDPELWRLTDW